MDNQLDIDKTVDAWSEIVIKVLRVKIAKLKIYHTGDLFNSLTTNTESAGDVIKRIYFYYNLYGKFVDMGVGRNYSRGNTGQVESITKKRVRKEWYSRTFYAQVMILGELMRAKYGEKAVHQIVATIEAVKDLKYNAYKRKI
jgi:hypothetical protein